MLKPVLHNPWVQAFGVLLALLVVMVLAYLLSPVLIPLFAAFMVAYLLDPVVDYFENAEGKNRFFRFRLPRGATISILAGLGVVLMLSVPLVLIPRLIYEGQQLVQSASVEKSEGESGAGKEEEAPQTEKAEEAEAQSEDGAKAAETDASELPWHERLLKFIPMETLVEELGWEEPGRDARAVLAAKIGGFVRDHATQLLESTWSRFSQAGSTLAQFAKASGQAVLSAVYFLANFALFAFVAGYLLKDFDGLIASARDLVPPRYRPKTVEIFRKIDHQLRSFVRGQVTVCLCLGVMYAVGLLICDVPFALAIALFGTFASLVPYLGVVLTVIPAVGMTLLAHELDWHIVGVIATFALAQGLEGNVLTPKIVGTQVGLHPVWVILAILVFGSALGFLGVLIAVPLAAALKVLVVEAVDYYKRSPVFEGEGSESPGEAPDSPSERD